MTKITYNNSYVNSNLIPTMDGALESINKAISLMNNTYVPSGFKYSTYLNEFKNEMYNKKIQISNIKDAIYKNNKVYDEIAESCKNEVLMISDIRISKRDNAVI